MVHTKKSKQNKDCLACHKPLKKGKQKYCDDRCCRAYYKMENKPYAYRKKTKI